MQSRDYLTVADGGVDVSVVITSGRNVVFDNLKVLPSTLVTSLQKAGRRNVRITGVSSTKVKGRPALSFHVSYTPAGTLSDPPIWFYTAIDDGSALVVVQTIDLPDAGTTAARLPRDRRLNQLLIDDVVPS